MRKKIGFGVIGCGMISKAHVFAIQNTADAALVGCCDASQEKAAQFAAEHGVLAFDSVDAMLGSAAIDAVCLCTPSGLHAPHALAAIARGKHVAIEKPMALNLSDADRIIEAADRARTQVCVISQMRFSPAAQALRAALKKGAFGRLVSASLSMKYFRSPEYYAASPWRGTWAFDGGGALMNQGIHGVDMLRYLAGPVSRVSAIARTQTRPIETEDSVVALLDFESGALGTLEASTTAYPGYPRRLEICGDLGSAILEENALLRWDVPGEPPDLPIGNTAQKSASDPRAIGQDSHLLQIGNFVDAISGRSPLLVDAREGRKPLEIITAVYASAASGKTVTL